MIERKVAGTKQVSTVGTVPADTPPLSFLDVSSALSPWTNYQYRLILHNQAGNTTGKTAKKIPVASQENLYSRSFHSSGPWVGITTRPSRPAGLGPPKVKVLGPDSLQVHVP